MRETENYCPKCEWRPKAYSRWQCFPSFGMVWNTFDRGRVTATSVAAGAP